MNWENLVKEYGLVTVVAVWVIHQIVRTWSFRTNTDTTVGATMTTFAVDFKEENRQLQVEVRALQSEQAREAGKLEMLEATLIRERKEAREYEREISEKLFEMKAQMDEFRKARETDQHRISELESAHTQSQGEIALLRSENKLLQAQKQELESLLEREINRANALSGLVEKINKVEEQLSNTQAIPNLSVDDTLVPEIVSAATAAAEETK